MKRKAVAWDDIEPNAGHQHRSGILRFFIQCRAGLENADLAGNVGVMLSIPQTCGSAASTGNDRRCRILSDDLG